MPLFFIFEAIQSLNALLFDQLIIFNFYLNSPPSEEFANSIAVCSAKIESKFEVVNPHVSSSSSPPTPASSPPTPTESSVEIHSEDD